MAAQGLNIQDKIRLHNIILKKNPTSNVFVHSKMLIMLKYLKTLILHYNDSERIVLVLPYLTKQPRNPPQIAIAFIVYRKESSES